MRISSALLAALALEASALAWMSGWGDLSRDAHPAGFTAAAIAAFCAYAAACAFLRFPPAISYPAGLLVSVVFRIILLTMEPGDDLWRYLWEGRVQNFGFNPYAYAPDDRALEALRTPYWSWINHPEYPAIYAPMTELIFRGLAALAESPMLFKSCFLAADLGVIVLLGGLVRHYRMDTGRVWWYAWNPLVVYSFAGGGHFDSLMIVSLAAALLLLLKHRDAFAVLGLTAAGAIKEIAFIAAPFFLMSMRRKAWLILPAAIFPFGWLFYGHPVPQWETAQRFWSIASSHSLVSALMKEENSPWLLVVFMSGWIWIVLARRFRPATGIHHSLSWVLMLSPSVHPWYLTWVLAFSGLTNFKAWWLLSGTMFFYFLTWNTSGAIHLSEGKGLETLAIYIPFYALFGAEMWNLYKRRRNRILGRV